MTHSYDHLPNAKHITDLFNNRINYPEVWKEIQKYYDPIEKELMYEIWNKNMDIVEEQDDNPLWQGWLAIHEVRATIESANVYIYEFSLLALTLFDCAHLLESSLEEVRILSNLGAESATLMLPMIIALDKIKEVK
jgi:hypothetical protein